ncbi:MAG TPA: FGGY family carbohydrate kinase, partial [Spirochaetia bacterium]|nr:FGGY family carbohydrate kinase [Spirochaetia bacterium]
MDCLLGIDLGTSYFKFALVDRAGRVQGSSRIAVPVSSPLPGRQEISADEFLHAIESGIAEAIEGAGIEGREICGISYSSQANSFIILDRSAQPLTPIILWSDHRVDRPGERLVELWQHPDYLDATGIDIRDRELAAAKMEWFHRTQPGVWERAARVLTISDYLTFLLTSRASGDESTASLLGMWDGRKGCWWAPALEAVGLREEQLAELQAPGSRCGETRGPSVRRLGLPEGVPFAVGSLDHYAAAVGAGLGCLSDTSESTGTVLACVHLHRERRPDRAYCTGPTAIPGRFYRLAFGPNGARGLEWLRNRLGGALSVEALADLASSSPEGARGLFAPAAIQPDAPLSEIFIPSGVVPGPGDFARAVMESTAASLAS